MQGQQIKDYLTLSSKKELRISITNSLLSPGWMNHNEVHRILPRRKMHTGFPPAPMMSFPKSFVCFTAHFVFTIFCGRWQSPEHRRTRSAKYAHDFCATEIDYFHSLPQNLFNKVSLPWRHSNSKSSEMLREANR